MILFKPINFDLLYKKHEVHAFERCTLIDYMSVPYVVLAIQHITGNYQGLGEIYVKKKNYLTNYY